MEGLAGLSWSERRVLVTGATGLIGSWLVRRLVDEGAHVVGLVLDADPQSELYRSGTVNRITVVNGRLEAYAAVERAIVAHGVDTVFHLGAQTLVGAAFRAPMSTFETNIRGTWHMLEAARVHDDLVHRLVIASSDKAYGSHVDLPYTEETALTGRHPYEVSKSCADLIAQSYVHSYGLPAAIARCGNVYGGGDLNWSRIVPGTIRSLLRDERPVIRSDGTHIRDYLHVADVVEAYLSLADALDRADIPGEAFNFSDESPRSVMEIYEAVCNAVGSGPVEPNVLGQANGEIAVQYLDASKARALLGWKAQVGIEGGLRRTVAWYRDLLTPSATPR
jgi:CDP-glucose 4,6-dehydratase